MKGLTLSLSGLALAAAACAPRAELEPLPPPVGSAATEARDSAGRLLARSSVSDTGGGIAVSVEAAGLAPGSYAAHVHTTGRCDPPTFDSAGPHWNPANRQHGMQNPMGPHQGDLPNLLVGQDGRGSFQFTIAGSSLGEMLAGDGAALVIHANPDDHRTDPSGNSGARIACGVYR